MKIVILTDSLGLPRNQPEQVSLEETYIDRLREKYPAYKILNISLGGATLNVLRDQYLNYYRAVEPDLVVVQSGIVDCAPRALKRWEVSLLERSKILKKFYNIFIRKRLPYLRKNRNITYTPPNRFLQLTKELYEACGPRLYWIEILPATPAYEEQLPGISSNITEYNRLIKGVVGGNLIETSDFTGAHVMSDHHHLSREGNLCLFNKLVAVIDSLSINNPSY